MPSSQLPLAVPEYLKEDEVSQEHRELLSTLHREKGWVATSLFQYQGFWHTSRQLQGVVACQQHFQAHHTDVLLVTTPKSGTTWLKALMFTLVNRVRFPCDQHHPLLTTNPHELVPFLEIKLYVEGKVPDLSSFTSPRILSTHLPLTSLPNSVLASDCKLVYLCRNPKDTFVSLWHFTNKLRVEDMGSNTLEEVFDKFCRGVSLAGPYWDHVLGYWKGSMEKPDQIFFLKYEEMKAQPHVHLRRLADFLGFPFSPEEESKDVVDQVLSLCSFDNLSNLEVNKNGKLSSGEEHRTFFRQGEVGDWTNYLTPEMVDILDHITEDKLHDSGLKFEMS